MDLALRKLFAFQRQLIGDMKAFFRLIVMLLPAPMFWALYDQQGSRWMLQSLYMDCRLWGNYLLLPDQMQTLNAVLILLFIPIFQIVIYPVVSKCFKITFVPFGNFLFIDDEF